MKLKLFAVAIAIIFSLSGCRQPVKTTPPTPTPEQAATPTPGQAEAQVPKLPERFANKTASEMMLKVYNAETKEISEMPVEEYLYGVLAGEMRNDWPAEALKAQAIIARTFLMHFLTENDTSKLSPEADISTDPEESQAYDPEGIDENIKKAVNETSGMVIAYDKEFIRAWFHSASGGRTADAVEGLNFKEGNPPYIQSVESDESQAPEEFTQWDETFTTDEISAALTKMKAGMEAEISDIKLGETGPSGRVVALLVNGNSVSAPEFRLALDSKKFRSTFISELRFDGSTMTVKGKGFGHGVGMPQWGAHQMATGGKKAEDIINYYFKDVSIVNLWDK